MMMLKVILVVFLSSVRVVRELCGLESEQRLLFVVLFTVLQQFGLLYLNMGLCAGLCPHCYYRTTQCVISTHGGICFGPFGRSRTFISGNLLRSLGPSALKTLECVFISTFLFTAGSKQKSLFHLTELLIRGPVVSGDPCSHLHQPAASVY